MMTSYHTKEKEKNTMMRNEFKTTVTLRRIDLCDLLIACTALANEQENEDNKWAKLHSLLESQLKDLDEALDQIIEEQ